MSRNTDQRTGRMVAFGVGAVIVIALVKPMLAHFEFEDIALTGILLSVFGSALWLIRWLYRTFRAPSSGSHQLTKSLRASIDYLRQCAIDAERVPPSDRDIRGQQFQLPLEMIKRGWIDKELLRAVQKRSEVEEDSSLEILINPVVYRRTAPQGIEENPEILFPFWVPAILGPDGELAAPERSGPWIPREYLEPVVANSAITIGALEVLDRQDPIDPRGLPFTEYWAQCDEFFKKVCGDFPEALRIDGYKPLPKPMFFAEEAGSANTKIVRLYNDILASKVSAGLLPALTATKQSSRRSRPADSRKNSLLHSGQFESAFPLSPSQRRAVHAALSLKDGEVLAVTGPPGTGKTTMIQSIVASYWVNGARRAVPPLMLSCSATNQATKNVLHSFAKAQDAPGVFHGRWLPELISYGLFCPSMKQSSEVTDLLYTLEDGKGPLEQFENEKYLSGATEYFLDRCQSAFSKVRALPEAIKLLRRELERTYEKLHVEVYRGTTDQSVLDQGLRHTLFQITTHYWEARWLKELPELLARTRYSRGYAGLEDWKIRAMISPLFVSTFAKAPSFFGKQGVSGKPPFDLFFSDEASQTSPELSGATLALSRRGVFIGDLAQLEPFSPLPEAADLGNLIHCGVIRAKDDPKLHALRATGQLVSSGSLMQQAISNSIDAPGIFLSEHRRSVPGIVEYSNRLCYQGKLQALRPEVGNRILPVFGYAHIRGLNRLVGTSRLNFREAIGIADWVRENQRGLEEHYQKPIEEILGIITPFRAQTTLLRVQLKEFPNVLVGTVNAIQGAERDIIIFSPVYSGNQQRQLYLLDRKPNLLNVAVSRARDSFLVFGDMEKFETGLNSPSSLLAEFLFSNEDNELLDVTPTPIVEESRTIARRFSDLDEHREVLIEALQTAKHRVIIVSPTISIYPIEHDSLDDEVREAVGRSVEILIFTDEKLNVDSSSGQVKQTAEDGRKLLADAGARVFIVNNIHNKSLAVDTISIIDGSFNWLSAVRKRGSANQKYERSIEYRGVAEDIELLLSDMRERIISEIASDPETTANSSFH